MTALILRLFWQSQHILFFCSSSSLYFPLHLHAFPGFVILEEMEEGAYWCLILVLLAGRCHVCAHPCCPQARWVQGIWRVPGPAHCQLMATASLPLACRGTTHWAAVSRAEQSDCVCPFTKANLGVVPSVLQRHKTQQALWKRKRVCSGSVEMMYVTIRCWELVGAWVTPKQTKYNKTNTWRSKHKKESCLQVGESTTFNGFFSLLSSPLPFIHVVIFSQWFYSGEKIQRVFHSSEILWQCRSPQHLTLPCQWGGLLRPDWWEAPDSLGQHWLPQATIGPPLPAARSHSCDPKHSCVSFFKSQEGELQTVWKMIKSGRLFKTTFIVLWNSCFPRVQMNPMKV